MGRPRLRAEAWISGAALLLTLLAFGGFLVTFGRSWHGHEPGAAGLIAAVAYLVIVGFLASGGVIYLVARLGYMRRRSRFRHAPTEELRKFADETAARVTVLVPSYKEEPSVVRQTLLSAALQDYPHRRVVLLIDDPPDPANAADARRLAATRKLADEINALLAELRAPYVWAAWRAERSALRGRLDRQVATEELAELYWSAAVWFWAEAVAQQPTDHGGALFAQLSLREPAERHAARAAALSARLQLGDYPNETEILGGYRELAALFRAEVTSFERKRYANLSRAPNKAMNLNSYISLMGSRVAERPSDRGWVIHRVSRTDPGLDIPDADYVLTLDADSLLDRQYALKLVHFLEREDNARIAIAQTPYSAIPNASRAIEQIAGATTDIQYVIHQGFTAHGATYWVGANALLRKRALEDIATVTRDEQTGQEFVRYIHDRTVIEDTESSVDLVSRGWELFNYPTRLSYSATPPDFGSLVVQRRRWSNGGLLILPKLLRSVRRRTNRAGPIGHLMRVHYLVSIAAVNVGLIALFLFPFADWYLNLCLPLACLPYFALYAHDLRLAGYRRRDVVRVYALNLMLIPVNLGGVAQSLRQAITGRATPFLRTPKVHDQTHPPPLYAALPVLSIVVLGVGGIVNVLHGRPLIAAGLGANAVLLGYAVAFLALADRRNGRGWDRTNDLSRVRGALSR